MEEIKSMLDENGKFKFNDIQILLDELVYNYDIAEESKEEIKQYKEDTNTYVKLYNEFNRKLPVLVIGTRKIEEKIEKIDDKQRRLNGRISKRELNERNSLEQQLEELKQQYVESKNNRTDAKLGYNETKEKYEELLKENKQEIAEKQYQEYASKLENICKFCLIKMREKDNKLVELQEAIKNCVDPANASGYVAEYSIELKEKNNFYSNYEEVIKMISKSEEYTNTVGKDLMAEITKELENSVEIPEMDTPEMDTPEVDIPEMDTPEVDTPEMDTPEVDTPEVDTPEVEAETVEAQEIEMQEENITNLSDEELQKELETPIYYQIQYPKILDTEPYQKDMSLNKMSIEQLAQEGPLFKDEERIDKDHDYMSYQNASNLNLVENELEQPQKSEEKVSFFQKLKEIKKEKEQKEIVNVTYAPEGLLNKIQYKFYQKVLPTETFTKWANEKENEIIERTK